MVRYHPVIALLGLIVSCYAVEISFIQPTSSSSWTRGTTQTISWSVVNNGGSIASYTAITLYRSSSAFMTIECATPLIASSTSCTWTVPTSQLPDSASSNFNIRLSWTEAGGATDYSNSYGFDIVPVSAFFSISKPTSDSVWYRGNTEMITWTTTPSTGITKVNVDLLSYSTLVQNIATDIANSGSTSFTIPDTIEKRSSYAIRITATEKGPQFDDVVSSTNYFDIFAYPITIKILKPVVTSNLVWYRGRTYEIQWSLNSGTEVNTVDIGLYSFSSLQETVASDYPNNGSLFWTVPTTVAPSSSYNIRVTTADFSPKHDVTYASTASFDIDYEPSSFEIISPTSDSDWTLGEVRTIEWKTIGKITKVKITVNYFSEVKATLGEELPNTGTFVWEIPATLSATYYSIKITAVEFDPVHEAAVADSDRFELVKTPPPPSEGPNSGVPFNSACAKLCFDKQLDGDQFCACMLPCGRLCLPGYKTSLSGFDPFLDTVRGQIFLEHFLDDVYIDSFIQAWKPEGISVQNSNVQRLSSGTKITKSLEEYQSSTSFGLSLPIPIKGAALTLGVEYQSMKQTFSSQSAYVGFNNYDRTIYTISRESLSNPEFSPGLLNDLNKLPLTYDKTKYRQFLTNYGAYYFSSVKFGIRARILTIIESCIFDSFDSSDVSASLEASGETAIDGASVGGGNSETSLKKCLQSYSSSSVVLIGGDTTKFACTQKDGVFDCEGSWDAYSKTVYIDPVPLSYELEKISTLFNSTYSVNIDKAIEDYIAEVKAQIEPVVPKQGVSCPCANNANSLNVAMILLLSLCVLINF